MPYITATQRYGSPQPTAMTKPHANIKKTMGRGEHSSAPASVTYKPTVYSLRSPPPSPEPYNHVVRPGGFSREARWGQPEYGIYNGSGQAYTDEQYPRWAYPETQSQRQSWQGTGQQYATQPYHNAFNQRGSTYWQQPTNQFQSVPSTLQAEQAWQYEYFRRYQYASQSPQYLLSQDYSKQLQRDSQYMLTQQWQIAGSAASQATGGVSSDPRLNVNAPTFNPQVPLKYTQPKPKAKFGNSTPYGGGFTPVQQLPTWKSGTSPWYGEAVQRSGPSANTRSQAKTQPSFSRHKDPKQYLIKRPQASAGYLTQALEDPKPRTEPQPLLVILDLNGTLLFRKNKGSNFQGRPFVPAFVHYLLKNHFVMVWSSARPFNVEGMCTKLFTEAEKAQLVAVWSRDDLKLSQQHYNMNVQVYKQLSWVWQDPKIQAANPMSTAWSQANSVLIDDSLEKAASEPYNVIRLEEFEDKAEQRGVDVLGQVVTYLEELRCQTDVSAYVRSKPFVFDAEAPFDWTPFVKSMNNVRRE